MATAWQATAVLNAELVERVVDLHRRAYALLRWMTDTLPTWTARALHGERSLPDALRGWLARHHDELPSALRPADDELAAIANLLASYLETTFAFTPSPGERLYSPDAHCFCPMCSWMVALPRLQPRKLTRADKQRADALRADALRALATDAELAVSDEAVATLLADRALREALALLAYGRDLLRRAAGEPTSPASLALWRGFAWTPTGAPRSGFTLTSAAILDAQATLRARLRAVADT